MGKNSMDVSLRLAVVRLLEQKGYSVQDVSSGSGVPKLSRLRITDERGKLSCAVKVTTTEQGRISFTRCGDGTYKVLSDCERVIYARTVTGNDEGVHIQMFDADVVEAAFNANFAARENTEQESLPMWLSPDPEPGKRFIGSGFGDKAMWSEIRPLDSLLSRMEDKCPATDFPPRVQESQQVEVGIMDQIKAMLAEHMRVRADQIELDVRITL